MRANGTRARVAIITGILAATMAIAGPALAAPANDAFADAIDASTLPFSHTTDTGAATTEIGEPAPSCAPSADLSVWYSFTSPGGTLELSTFGSKFDTVLAAYTGTGLGDLSELACNDDAEDVGSLQSRMQLAVPLGSIAHVQVSGVGGAAGKAVLSLGIAGGDTPGDDFATAIIASALPFTYVGDTTGYTAEAGEPPVCSFMEPQHTIWFRYDAPADGGVEASTAGSSYDTQLQAWSGSTLNALQTLACNDESESFDGTSRLGVRAFAGDTIMFQVDPYFQQGGPLTFTLDATDVPENDDFANATEVTLPFDLSSTTHAASVEPGEPQGCEPTGPSLWYTFTADDVPSVVVETESIDFEYPFYPLVTVWEGTSLGDLALVACGHGIQSLTTTSGSTYYVQVAGHVNEAGAVRTTGARGAAASALIAGAYASEDGKVGLFVAPPFILLSLDADLHLDDGGLPEAGACAVVVLVGLCI